ncbi:MAG: DUF86 domain-containing protein [Patescibacteria group bacterium]
MDRNLKHFKEDILVACHKICEYITDYTFESFTKDGKVLDAVTMQLIIIGEAANHFPIEVCEQNSEIRWASIVGLRNFVVHEYFEIDPKIIWNTATLHVPELKKQIKSLKI